MVSQGHCGGAQGAQPNGPPFVHGVQRPARWFAQARHRDHRNHGDRARCPLTELARSEKIYMSYFVPDTAVTLLAPDIVEAMLDGQQSATFSLKPC